MNKVNRFVLCFFVLVVMVALPLSGYCGDNSHWSKQFPKPATSTQMTGATGMSDGSGAPTVNMAKWYKGKLYLAGRWENALNAKDVTKRESNIIWYLWTWHPEKGYEAMAWRHSAQGGDGPYGVLNDFLFLPDGRLVIGGEFTEIGNLKGHTYHRVKGLCVYNPKEPTANRWTPLVSSVQHNAPGNIQTLAYDPHGNDLWVGGSFKGYRMEEMEHFCFGVQKYDFDSKQWNIMVPGVRGGTGLRKIKVDTSTTPSTIYMAGRFSHTGGNGLGPAEPSSTDRFSTGFAAWKADEGWITFPLVKDITESHEGVLQRAADFAFFDSVNIFDFLVDGKDIYVVGAFSEGIKNNGSPLRGIAKWDHEQQMWIDPTGKGGLGRDAYGITKAADGKIYVSGAFGGELSSGKYFDGFKNGEPAHMAICYDPEADTWTELGDGLGGYVMPVCGVTSHDNDVFFYGTFKCVGRNNKEGFDSYYLARYNSTVDFTVNPDTAIEGSDAPFDIVEPATNEPLVKVGLEHWSRNFSHPGRMSAGKTQQSSVTGMDDGAGQPEIKDLCWNGDTLYIAGSWEVMMNERWFVWTYHKEKGWAPIAFTRKVETTGWNSPPEGLAFHKGKLYVWGANEKYKGIATYDIESKVWESVKGTYDGSPVIGNGVVQGNPAINDVKWDSKTGDMYMAGSTGLRYKAAVGDKTVPSNVTRVDTSGVYHPMGLMLLAQNPSKPIKGTYCIHLDETKTPVDIYIGGTFGFKGFDSNHENLVYNIAKWDYASNDWSRIGKGEFRRIGMHDAKIFPEGYPGLPAQPVDGFPSFLTELYPRVRCITMDKAGNIYAGGSIGILDDNPDVTKRVEAYGIVKYDKASDKWVPAVNCGGVSRDVFDMTWLDDTRLLLSGGFLYKEDYSLLCNVAILDTTTGELTSVGGGLHKGHSGHVLSQNVHHTVSEDGYWFGGWFKYAGVDSNSDSQAPIESNYLAHFNPSANLDPNSGLQVVIPDPIDGVKGFSSKEVTVDLEATGVGAEQGTVYWYEKNTGGFKVLGTGLTCKAKIRVKNGMTSAVFYCSVKNASGIEGGKVPVTLVINTPE
jgi:hypothetical protein